MRYLDKTNTKEIIDKDTFKKWLPVDVYIGSKEHALLHLFYSRFMYKFVLKHYCQFGEYGINPQDPSEEVRISYFQAPFKELITQGIVKANSYQNKKTGQYIKSNELDKYKPEDITTQMEKMSSSKLNNINFTDEIRKYGIDLVRISIFYSSSMDSDIDYSNDIYKPIEEFLTTLQKISTFVDVKLLTNLHVFDVEKARLELLDINNKIKIEEIGLITEFFSLIDYIKVKFEERDFHVCIRRMMQLVNVMNDNLATFEENPNACLFIYFNYLFTLYPFSPFIACELYSKCLGKIKKNEHDKNNILAEYLFDNNIEKWTNIKNEISLLLFNKIILNVYVNGKMKGMICVDNEKELNLDDIINLTKNIKSIEYLTKDDVLKVFRPERTNVINLIVKT